MIWLFYFVHTKFSFLVTIHWIVVHRIISSEVVAGIRWDFSYGVGSVWENRVEVRDGDQTAVALDQAWEVGRIL